MLIVVWTLALVPEPEEEEEPPNKKSSVSVRRRKLAGEHQPTTNHLLPSFPPLNSFLKFSDESFTKEQQFKINSERKNFRAMRVV